MSQNEHTASIDQQRKMIATALEYLGVWGYPALCVVVLGMIGFVSTGGLPFDNGIVNLVFGIVTPLAIEGQAATFLHVARSAQDDGDYGRFFVYVVLFSIVAVVGIATAALGFYQWTFHTSLVSVLAIFGLTPQSWTVARMLVIMLLWVTGLWNLHVPKAEMTQEKANKQKRQMDIDAQLQVAQIEAQAKIDAATHSARLRTIGGTGVTASDDWTNDTLRTQQRAAMNGTH